MGLRFEEPGACTTKVKTMKKRGKKYQEALKQIDKSKVYSLGEGIELVKKISGTKFNSAVEVHINLGIDPKLNQVVRGTAVLPHGTGKKIKIAVFANPAKQKEAKAAGADIVGGEEMIKEIKQGKKVDFDVAVASPDMMKVLGPIAKILGQKGLMPNPKNETINPDPAKVVKSLKKGKITFKSDDLGKLHQIIGRVSFEDNKLTENFHALMEEIRKAKPKDTKGNYISGITLCSSMGPGIKISA